MQSRPGGSTKRFNIFRDLRKIGIGVVSSLPRTYPYLLVLTDTDGETQLKSRLVVDTVEEWGEVKLLEVWSKA